MNLVTEIQNFDFADTHYLLVSGSLCFAVAALVSWSGITLIFDRSVIGRLFGFFALLASLPAALFLVSTGLGLQL